MRDRVLSRLYMAARRESKRRVICRVRDDADDGVGMARLLDFITVET